MSRIIPGIAGCILGSAVGDRETSSAAEAYTPDAYTADADTADPPEGTADPPEGTAYPPEGTAYPGAATGDTGHIVTGVADNGVNVHSITGGHCPRG
jgi:hypothetical protein